MKANCRSGLLVGMAVALVAASVVQLFVFTWLPMNSKRKTRLLLSIVSNSTGRPNQSGLVHDCLPVVLVNILIMGTKHLMVMSSIKHVKMSVAGPRSSHKEI